MYKKLLIPAALLTIYTQASARGELKRGREVHLFATVAGDYHINNFDITHTDARYAYLQNPNNAGVRAGFELMYMGQHKVYISTGIEYNAVMQNLKLAYEADKAGYAGSNYTYRDYDAFTTQSIDWRWRAGYSVRVAPQYALEIGVGLTFNFVTNGKNTDTLMSANITDKYYKEPVMHYSSGWGLYDALGKPRADGIGMNLKGNGQIALRILEPALFNNRSMKIGLDGGYFFAGYFVNKAEASFYGPDRTMLNKAAYTDRHFSIGISVGVEL